MSTSTAEEQRVMALHGQRVVILGGTSGVGPPSAKAAACRGAEVIVVSRHKGQEVMTPRKIPGQGGSGGARRISGGRARLRILLALPAAAAAAAALAACSSAAASPSSPGSSSPAAAAASTVKTATIAGVTVLTNSKGFTLYSFAPDTPTTSECNGTCAQNWPPLEGPVTAAGVTGTFGTIKRSDGSTQATFDGHPLYTFAGDTAPGQNKGNDLDAAGGLWHEITASGTAAPAPAGSSSPSSSGGGY
jgi:predicted lipoprotein with Yx(FWY)xxD motif